MENEKIWVLPALLPSMLGEGVEGVKILSVPPYKAARMVKDRGARTLDVLAPLVDALTTGVEPVEVEIVDTLVIRPGDQGVVVQPAPPVSDWGKVDLFSLKWSLAHERPWVWVFKTYPEGVDSDRPSPARGDGDD